MLPYFVLVLGLISFSASLHAKQIRPDENNNAFAPHKALYDISLLSSHSGSQIVNISGQMFYEWNSDCDGWNSNHRFNLLYEYTDSQPLRITSDFSTFEAHNGESLSFSSQRKHNGELIDEIRGSAVLDKQHMGEAVYNVPKELSYELPEGSLFPVAHSIAILEKIKEGKKFFNTVIFDGSDEDGPVEVNTFIGKPKDVQLADSANIDKALLQSPAHEVRLAFFPLKDASPTSDYEMTLTFHENGIISDMVIDYDDFTVRQKLIALEGVEKACGTQKSE